LEIFIADAEQQAFERLLDKLASHVPHWAAPGDL
jgi:hypothetical protein